MTEALVDKLILTEIYSVAGRESRAIKRKVSSAKLAKAVAQKLKIKNLKLKTGGVVYIPTIKEIESYLKQNLQGGEVVVIMGAGDIYNLVGLLQNENRG